MPLGHHARAGQLQNIAATFAAQYREVGDLDDLEAAQMKFQEALDLTPEGHPDRAGCLQSLAYITRSNRSHPKWSSGYAERVKILGVSFINRYQKLGDLSDLEAALHHLQQALDLMPETHPDHGFCLQFLEEFGISTFVIYSPETSAAKPSPPNQPTSLTPEDQTSGTEFPNSGIILSTHSPEDVLVWVEAHYDDPLFKSMRDHGVCGPIAAMLSPDESALVIFGSILDDGVLAVAKTLSEVSQFTVMIRPQEDDPVKRWRSATEEVDHSVGTDLENTSVKSEADNRNGLNEDLEDTLSMTGTEYSTDSETDIPLGDGSFRLRGGARKHDKFKPWFSPEHNFYVYLKVMADVECQVAILSTTQFTIQSKYTDETRQISRPQAISRTRVRIIPSNRDVWPDRSYSRVVFLANEHISECIPLPCDGYTRPNRTVKTVETKTKGITTTGTFNITPKWIVDYEDGPWGNYQGQSYWVENVSYTATEQKGGRMQADFSVGINVEESNSADFPDTAFGIQSQTMLWMRHKSLKAQGYGVIVLTSSYIPDMTTQIELSTRKDYTFELAGISLTDKTNADGTVPAAPPLSIVSAPAERPGFLKSIFTPKSSVNRKRDQSELQLSHIPLDDFKARGWDVNRERWRMPEYPPLDDVIKQLSKDFTAPMQALEVNPTLANLPKSKGKQHDPGPSTLEQAKDEEAEMATDGLNALGIQQDQIQSNLSGLNKLGHTT
ncbi:hypothetical protein B0H14DRAFT_2650973 [Mycena olivaceomarginata]|nr:hypothetical protein B0H14DRAFT_2650973 [Mycena olivaceomarginata]